MQHLYSIINFHSFSCYWRNCHWNTRVCIRMRELECLQFFCRISFSFKINPCTNVSKECSSCLYGDVAQFEESWSNVPGVQGLNLVGDELCEDESEVTYRLASLDLHSDGLKMGLVANCVVKCSGTIKVVGNIDHSRLTWTHLHPLSSLAWWSAAMA